MGFSGQGLLPIFKAMGNNLTGVEIGVCRGKNIKYLLDNCPNIRKIYGIDPWEAYPAIDQETQDGNYIKAKQLLNSYQNEAKAVILKMRSDLAARGFNDNSQDFVFIDGDHSYEAVLQDLRLWYPKVKKGGLFSGHDYRPQDKDVRKAVQEFAKEIGATILEAEYYSWYWFKGD